MPFLHLILSIAAGLALFWLVRRAAADRALSIIIVTGFLVRAAAGIGLFWISYLRLPVAKGLQMGQGLWFFALDALQYYPQALAAAHHGVVGIAAIPRTSASVSFVQVLAASLMLFGESAATAVLLNLLCYSATCAILVAWLGREPSTRAAATVAVAAVSFAPSSILWATQPLKDTFFQFSIVVFIAACALWQRRWRESARPAAFAAPAAVMLVALSAITGTRWYFAFALLIAFAAFAVLLLFTIPAKRTAAAAASVALLLVMSRIFLFIAQPYVPPAVDRALEPWHHSNVDVAAVPQTLTRGIVTARQGFEASGGATQISAGDNMAALDGKQPASAETEREPVRRRAAEDRGRRSRPAPPASDDTAKRVQNNRPAAAAQGSGPSAVTASPPPSAPAYGAISDPVRPLKTDTSSERHTAASNVPAASVAANTSTIRQQNQSAPPAGHAEPSKAAAKEPPTTINAAAPPAAPRPQQESESRTSKTTTDRVQTVEAAQAGGGPKKRQNAAPPRLTSGASYQAGPPQKSDETSRQLKPPSVSPVQQPLRAAAPPARPASNPDPHFAPPESHIARFVTGAAAVLVPRAVAQSLGIFRISGGRGMWWFSEIDTLFFDVIIASAAVLLLRRRSGALMNPAFWLVLLALLLVGIPLVYAVTNFGTLFRLRGMLLTVVALLPVVVAADRDALFRAPGGTGLADEA